MNVKEKIGEIFVEAIAIVILNLLVAACGTFVYNLVIPSTFGLPVLTYWKFYGIMFIINCLRPIKFNPKF